MDKHSRSGRAWLSQECEQRGLSRRDFMRFCSAMASALALPATFAPRIAAALGKAKKPILVWLEFQDCAGNTESFLRAARPTAAEVVLDVLSVDYHETIMAAAGHQAEDVLKATVRDHKGEYLAVVEGSIPTGEAGAYCCIAGRSALDIAREVCGGAAATIAMGTCATFGGLPAAAPNPTGALGVGDAVPGVKNLINLSACPANAENLTALIVHYLTFKSWPALDAHRRPLFAYGKAIHDGCERRAHFDAGQYVEAFGDEGHRHGYCLYKMGCKGPVTHQNCPTVRWNEGTNWPIGCGHPCIGCAEPDFWDKMAPFYRHLPGAPGFGVMSSVDTVGLVGTAAVGTAFAAHALVSLARGRRKPDAESTPPAGAGKGS
ncbi:MAG TPA: hydrogenase small subunit [Anaeromyxobacteraceae bacterium]|nr:hydrogenase small subunit [Anaeromyxobacteraceae bacterium]